METKNTVTINLEYYNELRDFHKGIEEGKFLRYTHNHYYGYYVTLSKDETIAEYEKELLKMRKEIDDLVNGKEVSIYDIKKMNIWQFLKWKYSLKRQRPNWL